MIKITASFSGVIATGSYQNEKPMYAVEEQIDRAMTDKEIEDRQKQLQEICYNAFKQQEAMSTASRIAREREDIRFYPRNGEQYPSVTSIINLDADWFGITPQELIQYAARGTIIHKQIELYINTGEWKEAKDIPELRSYLMTIKKGNKQLGFGNVNFPAFLKKYPIEFTQTEHKVYNDKYKYAGTTDAIGSFIAQDKPIEGIVYGKKTLFDFKPATTAKEKALKQLSAYAHCLEGIEQICVVMLNYENQQGYSKPVIVQDYSEYWDAFLVDRENFKKRFGV